MRAGRLPPSAAVVLVSLAALAAPFPASAQANTGTILGTVRDPSGATLSGAWVRVRNLDTGESREVETMGGGLYRAPGLGLGRYEVRVERAGFQPSVRTGIALSVSEEAVVDLELVLGAVREAVVVEASAAPVETTRATLSHLVDGRRIRFLPLNGRDYAQLLLLQPGVVLSRSSAGSANVGRGIKVSVAGARPNQNLFTLDGTDLNDALNTTPASAQGLMTGVESVQEFRVVTQAMSAEYGRAVGGVFQVATRSGTNTFHGSAFAFHRNDALDARNYFDLEKPDFSRHQFGGTLGGPLARDRTFFFMGYEGLREGKGITQVAAVPDAEARRGRLPGRAPFAVNPLVAPYLRLFPEANGPLLLDAAGGPTGLAEYRGVLDRGSTEDMGLVRLDHRFSGTDSLFVRYLFGRSELDEPVNLPQFPNVVRHRRHLLTLEQRHLFSPSVLSELRLGLGRSQPSEDVQPDDPYEDLAFVPGAAFGELVVGGGATAVGTDRTNPKRFHQDQLQVSETVYVQAGRHALKAGLGFSAFRFDGHSETRTRGQLRFRSLEDFLRGRTRDFQVALPGSDFTRRYRQELFGAYVQDDFRVRPRLTLNLGLRYELATTPREADGKVSNLRRIEDARMTVGDPLFRNPTGKSVAPRLGFAWAATDDGRSSLRGGVGVFYEAPLFFQYRSPIFRSLPFVSRAVLVRPALPIDTSLASASGPLETESFTFEPEAASVVRYNLVGQRELGRGTVVTLGYVGSRGRNLFGQGDTNTARPEILADGSEFFPEDAPRRNPAFLAVDTIFQGFRSRYDSLQVGVVHRRESLRLQAAYTLGSSRDNRSGSGGRQEFTNGQARTFDPYDLDRDWGPSDFDVRHNLVANASWEFRLGRGWLGDGWQVNGIATYASGLPFTPIIPGDPDRDGSDSNVARPDALPGATTVPAGGRSAERWFDPAAFSFPTLGTRGNAGRNSLRGPALALVDVGLVKTVPLRGTAKLQLRLEVFNVLNRANLDLPLNDQDGAAVFDDGGQPNPTAGRISRTVTDAREAQIALKLIF